jgi:glutaryl-CoA dehydrogenase
MTIFDFFLFDEGISSEESMTREAVNTWVRERFMPLIQEHHRQGTFPMELVPELGELGVFGANLEGYGCAGMNQVEYGLIMQELERGDSGLRSFASVQGSLVMYPILKYGTEEQRKKWLPQLASGRKIGCFGLTEPDHGSDPGSMKTRAFKDGDHWILRGSKMWITNGSVADVAVVWAKDEDNVVRGFLVEKGTPGFTAPLMKGKFSLRASVTSELVFDDVRVPESNLLLIKGLKGPLTCLSQARYGIAWGAIGAAMDCFNSALEYTQTRNQFGRPLASFQLVQSKLTDMINEITKAQFMVLHLGRLKDRGKAHFSHISLAKMNNVAMALDIARSARDMHGANGITDEYPVIRHMMNLESVKTYEGTHDIHKLIVGQTLTGLSAF